MKSLVLKQEAFQIGYEQARLHGLYLPPVQIIPLEDVSFTVYKGSELVLFFPCFVLDGIAGWHDGTSTVPLFAPDIDFETLREAAGLVRGRVDELLHRPDVTQLKILCTDRLPSEIFDHLDIEDNSRFYGYIDLTLSSQEIRHDLRKSYRSLINKGAAIFERKIYWTPAQLPESVTHFIRQSRGITDEVYYGMIYRLSQASSAVFSYSMEGQIVGVIEICAWNKFSSFADLLYSIGAFNYEIEIPKHFCLFDAALYFKDQPHFRKCYILNASRRHRDINDKNQAKLAEIDFFKRGFCNQVFTRSYKVLRLPLVG